MTTFVDTNVFVYAKDQSAPERKETARRWLDYLWDSRSGRVSMQVLSEYYNVVTRKLRPAVEPGYAREEVHALCAWEPVAIDSQLLHSAWAVESRYGLSWWDSLIVAAAQRLDCDRLLSEDFQHGQRFDGVLVVSPFLEAPPSQ
jgi:predicted nucleic acid-binding protein